MKLHFILPWAMLSFLVFVVQPVIEPQTQGRLNIASGGIDSDERMAVQAMRRDDNLSLLYLVEGEEKYRGDVKGSVKNADGNTFTDAESAGLMLFPEFKPGRYIESADRRGQMIDKTINAGGKT